MDSRTAAPLSVVLLCSTVGLMIGGASPIIVWCSVASTILAAVWAMVPDSASKASPPRRP